MTTAAAMLVKDEVDVVGHTVEWLLSQVDQVIVADNGSTDGTLELLYSMVDATVIDGEPNRGLWVRQDPEVGYYQDRKMTALAAQAYESGHDWVIPCDADEFWRLQDPTARIGDVLADLHDDVRFVSAELYDHKVTSVDDDDEPNPARRMGWRFHHPGKLPKVAARTSPGLRILMGNHGATARTPGIVSSSGFPPTVPGLLVVEHYTWRSANQLVKKIRNGWRAYAKTEGLDNYGAHWKAFGRPDDPQFEVKVRAWFDEWAYAENPYADESIGLFPWWPEPVEASP